MSVDTLEQRPEVRHEGQSGTPTSQTAPIPLSPIAIVALSALGIVIGGGLVLQLSPWGSLGRYQFAGFGQRVVRIDTTSGAISACYFDGGNIGRPATCFPWSQASRDFVLTKDPAATH